MNKEYQLFSISNFRTGFDESVEPWLLPRDAYQVVVNAHLYRGVLEKIDGYRLFAKFTNRKIQSLGTPDGVTTTFTGTLSSLPTSSNIIAYGSLVVGSTSQKLIYSSDASATVVNLTGAGGSHGTVDITTGAYSITFGTAPPSGTYSAIYIEWDSAPAMISAIMGIKPYYGTNGVQEVLVFDQKRVGKIVPNNGIFAVQSTTLQVISEITHDYYQSAIITGDGTTTTFAGTLGGAPFEPETLFFTEFNSSGLATGNVISDNGAGGLTGPNVTSGSVNYVTGAYTITFSVAPISGNYYDSTTGVYGDLFTGSISNFFSLTNYQYKAFFCNNINPIFYYDGNTIHYLNTNVTVKPIISTSGIAGPFDISKCLHVFTNRERLLLIAPLFMSSQALSTVYWSVAQNPLVFTNQEFLQASTSEYIKAIGFINSDLVIRFSNSERIFRYTGDAFAPFRFDSTNNIWACDASYSSINYDTWFSTVGRPAIVGSDAVNVKRVDEIIPDFTDPTRLSQQTPVPFMNQTSIQQCYGERFDDIKEGWLCYNSGAENETVVMASDNVLAFNYLDSTYAVYSFPFSCLGFGRIVNVPTWGTIYTNWADMSSTWDSYQLANNALLDLAGDQFDKVYELNSGSSMGDQTTPILMNVISKNFNPFIEDGQLCRLGYIDLFVSASQITKLRVQFYVNDQLYTDPSGNPAGFYQETTLTFDPTDAMSANTQQIKIWKRIYVGAVGKEHTIRFYQNPDDFTTSTLDQPVFIHAMQLAMRPAGRIFN